MTSQRPREPLLHKRRRPPKKLLAACALFFGAAFFTVRFPDVPGAGVGSFVSTLAIALPSVLALWRFLGPRRAALSLLALSAFGFAIETTGVVTGFPYGTFYYGDSLGYKVGGLVPYLLPLSWVPLVLGAVAATGRAAPLRSALGSGRWGVGSGGKRYLLLSWVFSAAALLTLVDGVLDPGAASLGFWIWPGGGPYYGVPLSNYAGWLFSSSIAAALLLALGGGRWEETPPPGFLDSLLIALAFWTGVAVFSGLLFPVLLGAVLFVVLLLRRSRLAGTARVASSE